MALELFARACMDGDSESCVVTLRSVDDSLVQKAKWKLWPLCEKGDLLTCRRLHGLLGFPDEPAQCAAGNGIACHMLFRHTHQIDTALRACDLGIADDCFEVADDVQRKQRGVGLLVKGCAAGYWLDCLAVANQNSDQRDEIAFRRVFDLAAASCLAGDLSSCDVRDPEPTQRALATRMMHCVLEPTGCSGVIAEIEHHSLPNDPDVVRRAYAIGCLRLLRMSDWPAPDPAFCLTGAALQTDPELARRMRDKACKLGNPEGCKGPQPNR